MVPCSLSPSGPLLVGNGPMGTSKFFNFCFGAIFSYDLSRFYFWALRVPLLVGPWAGMSRNRARSRARKHARDHRLPRAINYGAVCMESLNIGRGSTIRREIARVIAIPTAIGVRAPRCSVTSLHGDFKI